MKTKEEIQSSEEILREYIEFKDVNGSETIELLPLTVCDAMEEYASQFQQEWIPVEVRLPEDTKNVDVTILNEGISKVVTDWYDKDRKGWTMSRNVIAWKPKPQPYNPTKS